MAVNEGDSINRTAIFLPLLSSETSYFEKLKLLSGIHYFARENYS